MRRPDGSYGNGDGFYEDDDLIALDSDERDRECPMCGSYLDEESVLGVLGLLRWFRCIFCGAEFSEAALDCAEGA